MRRIRLHLNGSPAHGLTDALTRKKPAVWDADGLRVQVFLADAEDKTAEFDIDTISALTLEIRADDETVALLAGPVEPEDDLEACTYAEWVDDDGQHAEFLLTGAQLNFANGAKRFWLSVRAEITDSSPVTFGAGYVEIRGSQHGDSADPADAADSDYPYLVSITPDENGLHTFQAAGYQWKQTLIDFTEAEEGAGTGIPGGFVYLRSTTPDDNGLYLFSARGYTWRASLIGLTAL